MYNPRLASRYANSLLGLAIEQNQLDAVYTDMLLLQQITKSSHDFVMMLRSPIIKSDKKQAVLDAVLNGKLGVITQGFLKLIVSKGREYFLPEIIVAFIQQYKKVKSISEVKLTTAFELDNSLKQLIADKIKSKTPLQNVELNTSVDPELIGGFTIEVEDKLWDASIARDLHDIRKQFLDNIFVQKI